jgi:hypothetical protein
VAAAYLLHTLRGNGVDVPHSCILWVPVEDRVYQQLRSFLRQQRPAFLITLGIPLENTPGALDDVVDCVSQGTFVFDHHLAATVPAHERLVVVNPSPTPELSRARPMPASLFGYLCAERAGRDVAPWLVGVALLDEGIEEQVAFFYEELSRLHDLPSPGMVGGPGGLRQTVYGRISRLLTANFSAREPDHISLDLALQVLGGTLPGTDELLEIASERLARLANSVTTEVRRHVDTWRQRITAYFRDERFVKIEVPSELNVAAPVASVLATHFPEKTFITYTDRGGSARVEIRSPSGGPDLGAVLTSLPGDLASHSVVCQRSVAALTVSSDQLERLLDALRSKLDPTWSDDEDE